MKEQLRTILISLGSALVGAVVVVSVQGGESSRPPPAVATVERPEVGSDAPQAPRTSNDPALQRRLASLEARLAQLGEQGATTYESAEEAPSPHAFATPEEAAAAATERRETRDRQYATEAPDPQWSRSAADSIRADLEGLSEGDFRVDSVDCRTTQCRVDLTWTSYTAAQQGAPDIAGHGFATNCMKDIYTPAPETGRKDAPYTASLYFDCTDFRADAQ